MRRLLLLLLVLALTGCTADEPAAVLPPDHAQVDPGVDSAADRSCVEVGEGRELPAAFTGSSSITLAEVRAVAGAVPLLTGGPYEGLPDGHPVVACFYDDGQTITSLIVDADGRVAPNPAVPQGGWSFDHGQAGPGQAPPAEPVRPPPSVVP